MLFAPRTPNSFDLIVFEQFLIPTIWNFVATIIQKQITLGIQLQLYL